MMRRLLTGCRIFDGTALHDDRDLLVEDGRIVDLPRRGAGSGPAVDERVDLPADALLVPGFIDHQVNGAGGVLFNRTPTPDAARAIAAAMRPFGTTGLLPTFITDDRTRMIEACKAAEAAMGAGVLGVHLEGPFLNEARRGVHEPRFVRAPDDADIDAITALAGRIAPKDGRVLVTLAPEVVSDAHIRRLVEAGVVVSAGHTAATAERVDAALALGVRGFTHLGNAMPPVVNREPGPVGAAMASREAWCAIIADGHHVHPTLLRAVLAAKPAGKVMLVTDAMDPVGTDATEFELYGQTILRRGGRLVTTDGTLAGADIDMAASVRNAVALLGVPLPEALRMASLYPAAFLGLDHRLGRLAPGYQADLALVTERVDVLATWVGGEVAWHNKGA